MPNVFQVNEFSGDFHVILGTLAPVGYLLVNVHHGFSLLTRSFPAYHDLRCVTISVTLSKLGCRAG